MTRIRSDRGGIQAVLAAAAALLLLPVLLLAAATGYLGQQAAACAQPPPARLASASIPARYLALYRQAGQDYGIPWEILAGIGEAETGHGRSPPPASTPARTLPGRPGPCSSASAAPPGTRGAAPPSTPPPGCQVGICAVLDILQA
jgi:hypothetical protein